MESNNPVDFDWGLKPLHEKMLEMLKYLHQFCEQHKIEYCLAYGSALGAIRHQGFIPWDDDVDVYMTPKSYEKFRRVFTQNGDKEKYCLQEIDPIDGMLSLSKLRMNGTTFIEPLYKESGIHQGIYIDIFILHNAPNSKLKRRIMCLANQYLTIKGLSNRKYKKKAVYRPILALLRLFPKDFLRKSALKAVYKYDNCNCGTVFDNDLRIYKKSFYKKEWVFPAKISAFEDTKLFVPGNYSAYLKNSFGDYMVFPDFKTISNGQHASIWDVNKNYTEYLKEVK